MKDKLKEFFTKNKKPVIIGGAVLLVIIIGVIIGIVSCGGKDNNDGDNNKDKNDNKKGESVSYTLNIQTEGGMILEDLNVYVYEGGKDDELLAAGKTDENGKFKFETDVDTDKLGVALQGLPEEGYKTSDVYKISKVKDDNLYIYISTEIVKLDDMSKTKFELGSIIKDFTVTTSDGKDITISKLLEEKDAVVLNFFYLGCMPCKNEMPYLEDAYKKYSDKLELIAMTPVDKDDDKIKEYVKELGLTFPVAQCASEWEQMMELKAYPTTVVIDKWGMISFIHEGSVTESGVFEVIFDYFTAADYKQGIVKHLDDIVVSDAEEGTESNPIDILPDAAEFEAKVAAGKEVYYEIPKVTNMLMTIKDADAYIIYNEEKYEAKDGEVKVVISAPDSYTPARFVIGNKANEDKTFKVTLSAVKGTMMNPYEVQIGAVKIEIEAGNEQGVYHTFTATENGTLTYKPVSVTDDTAYDVTLYNLNTYANRTLSADKDGDGTVSIVVNKGDVVQIIVSTLPDDENEYPAATVTGELLFVAGEGTGEENNAGDVTYTVTVKDAAGNALSGINVVIDTVEAVTDGSGVVTATLKSGSYSVGITPPTGYKVQGDVIVTADMPSITVTLVSVNAKQISYTVKVTDEGGKAISGATVIIGNSIASTDGNGNATLTLAEGTYDVTVSASGYEVGNGSVSKSSTSTTVKLKKSTGTTTGVAYTVNAVDYNGAGISGVTVVFKSGGVAKATATTDASGKATATLPSGNYDVTLAYNGYGFDSSSAKVSAGNTTAKVTMAPIATNVTYDVYFDENTGAYYITNGGQYVEIPSADSSNDGGNAFFLFEPTQAGTYKISVSSSSAAISYWGGSTFFISNATDSIEHTATSLTLNVKEAGPTYIIGVKGVSNTVISVVRTGNAVLDENDMAWTDYVGTDTVKPYSLGSGKLTYVDITKPTSTYNLVYNSADGYYHLGSTSGPVMLVHLGTGAPQISLSDVIGYTGSGGSNFGKYIYDGSGNLIKKENYTNLLMSYMQNMDQNKFVYPLTKDLMYMIKNGGEFRGWWSATGDSNPIYDAKPNLNTEIAWMWACCYVAQ